MHLKKILTYLMSFLFLHNSLKNFNRACTQDSLNILFVNFFHFLIYMYSHYYYDHYNNCHHFDCYIIVIIIIIITIIIIIITIIIVFVIIIINIFTSSITIDILYFILVLIE